MTTDKPAETANTPEEVSRIITMLESGASHQTDELIPLVYEDLRRLARSRLAQQPPGQTLQATALVHEAYMRIEKSGSQDWENRAHFFAAAAESMRRIVIDNIRAKQSKKRGGEFQRVDFEGLEVAAGMKDEELLAVDEALERLESENEDAARLVKLRFFAGLTLPEVAKALDISERTAHRRWNYARAWLFEKIHMD